MLPGAHESVNLGEHIQESDAWEARPVRAFSDIGDSPADVELAVVGIAAAVGDDMLVVDGLVEPAELAWMLELVEVTKALGLAVVALSGPSLEDVFFGNCRFWYNCSQG